MSKLKFEPSDFNTYSVNGVFQGHISPEIAANFAQKRFNEWLSEQPVVYGGPQTDINKPLARSYSTWKREGDDVTARLICIEPIDQRVPVALIIEVLKPSSCATAAYRKEIAERIEKFGVKDE